jgi:hypothetical protein
VLPGRHDDDDERIVDGRALPQLLDHGAEFGFRALRFAQRQIGRTAPDALRQRVEVRHRLEAPETQIVKRRARRGAIGRNGIVNQSFGRIVGKPRHSGTQMLTAPQRLRMWVKERWPALVKPLCARSRDNCKEIGRLQAGASHQRAADFGSRQDFRGIARLDRAAIENANASPGLAQKGDQPRANVGMHIRNFRNRRRASGADRPDGLIGDRRRCAGCGRRHAVGDLPCDDFQRPACIALGLGFADTDDGEQPGAPGGFALAATAASLSEKYWRRSECPTMTAVAPASLSISALVSPVNAPDGSAWQSWPPMAMRAAATPTARQIKVAGGQIRMSTSGGEANAASATVSISGRDAKRPFIFQLPAMRCRMLILR